MKNRAVIQPTEKLTEEIHGSFDLLKFILAYVVILRHFISFFLGSKSTYSVLICEVVSRSAVPIYFMLSGYFFFLKPFSMQRLKHQLLRILRLYFAWGIIYFPVILLGNIKKNEPLFEAICSFIRYFVFPGSHLWYLIALVFALIFVSMIHNMNIWYAAMISTGMFIVGLLFDTYGFLVPQLSGVIEIYSKVFLTTRSGLLFGTLYVYLGYIFSRFEVKIKCIQAAFGIVVSLLLLCVEGILLFEYRGISKIDITIFALPVAVFVFLFAQRQRVKMKKEKLLFIRKLSTVLYCIHVFFAIGFLFISHYIIAIPIACSFALVILGSTVASAIIVKLSEKYKLISYLV